MLSPLSLSSSKSVPSSPVAPFATVKVVFSFMYPVSSAGTGSVVEDETVKVNWPTSSAFDPELVSLSLTV